MELKNKSNTKNSKFRKIPLEERINSLPKLDSEVIGQKFNMLTVVKFLERRGHNRVTLCKCDCGKEKTVLYSNLLRTLSCGCASRRIDVGVKQGMLTVLSKNPPVFGKPNCWRVRCDCGKEKDISNAVLVHGTQSCGCLSSRKAEVDTNKRLRKFTFKGVGEISSSLFHRIMNNAKARNLEFTITLEYAWNLFLFQNRQCALSGQELQFPKRGEKNCTASLDRIDSKKGYIPTNVQWIHKDLNFIKRDLENQDFINMCKSVAKHTVMKKNKIIITGACGFLGQALIERWHKQYDIVAFNRDENKQFYSKLKYPNVTYVLGDIKDEARLIEAAKGCSYGVFAASMKHIDMVADNPDVACETILTGAINSRKAAVVNNLIAGVFVSSDKSQNPATLYGALKMAGAECFISDKHTATRLTSLSYGNIFSSSGSILVKLNKMVQEKDVNSITLFSDEMTRFGMHVDQAIDLIELALFGEYKGVSLVPKLWSYRVVDLFDIYKEKFGINYIMGKPRPNEKLHEIMIPEHTRSRAYLDEDKDIYVIDQKQYYDKPLSFNGGNEYSSKDYVVSKNELSKYLEQNNYFQ